MNRFRIGEFTEEDEETLKKRVTLEPFLEQDAAHVMYTNKEVTQHNQKMIDSSNAKEFILTAIKTVPKGYTCKVDKDTGNIDKTNFKDKLVIKIGVRVSLVFNINTVDELVNGALGTVIALESNSEGNVESIIVQFDQDSAGFQQRE